MEKALTRINERTAVSMEVKCPSCRKDVTVLVKTVPGKTGTLVNQVKCKCNEILPSGSRITEYD